MVSNDDNDRSMFRSHSIFDHHPNAIIDFLTHGAAVVDLLQRLNEHIRKKFQRYHPTQNELTLCQFSVVVVDLSERLNEHIRKRFQR